MKNGKGYRLYRKLKPLLLISREEWGALPPRTSASDVEGPLEPIDQPVPKVIVSYSEDPICNTIEECKQNVRNIQKQHMEEGYVDIKYNFLVGSDGNVYEGRGWPYKPAIHGFWPEWYGESYEISHMGFHGLNLPMYMAKAAYDTIEVGISKNCVIPEGPIFPDLWKAYSEGLVGTVKDDYMGEDMEEEGSKKKKKSKEESEPDGPSEE